MKKLLVFLSLMVFLVSCGGGGGGESDGGGSSSASGIWVGSFTSTTTKNTYTVYGIVTESNIARFVNTSNGSQYSGVVSVSGNSLSSTVTAYASSGSTFPDGSSIGTVNLSGTVSTRSTLSGSYSGVGDSGAFSLVYSNVYERGSSLSTISGTYESGSTTVTIDSNGNVSGSYSGCSLSGSVSIIDSAYNAYNVDVTVSSCSSYDGSYSGLACLYDTYKTNDTLIAGVSSSSTAITVSLLRQ